MPDPSTFAGSAHRRSHARVEVWLRQIYGEQVVAESDHPSFHLRHGSCAVTVEVRPWCSDRGEGTLVDVFSVVATGAKPARELFEHLLRSNSDMNLGAFMLDADGDIVFSCTLLGDTLDKDELRLATLAVLQTADDFDDEIVRRYGGQTARQRAEVDR